MTQPSAVVDAIARTLAEVLEPDAPSVDTPRVDVISTDITDTDVGGLITFADPAIVVSCLGLTNEALDYGPMFLRGDYIARCYARTPAGPDAPAATRGDVAMDLAAIVAQLVDTTLWTDADGHKVVARRAERVAIRNVTSHATTDAGRALWIVTWSQLMEFTRDDQAGLLRAFKRLRVTMEMGDADTADVLVHVDMQGGTPP